MARLDVPDGPGGEAAMLWTLRPQPGGIVERMIRGAYRAIDDAFFARLRVLDLTLCVAVFLGLGRSLTVLGVDQSCAIDV
jgi:hypothetical protein